MKHHFLINKHGKTACGNIAYPPYSSFLFGKTTCLNCKKTKSWKRKRLIYPKVKL